MCVKLILTSITLSHYLEFLNLFTIYPEYIYKLKKDQRRIIKTAVPYVELIYNIVDDTIADTFVRFLRMEEDKKRLIQSGYSPSEQEAYKELFTSNLLKNDMEFIRKKRIEAILLSTWELYSAFKKLLNDVNCSSGFEAWQIVNVRPTANKNRVIID